jgi:hypothetical protein
VLIAHGDFIDNAKKRDTVGGVKIHRDIEQGSDEWFALRAGRATASCFADVLAKGQGKMRAAYLRRIVAECLTGKSIETYRNAHMDRGRSRSRSRAWPTSQDRLLLDRVGFIEHDRLRLAARRTAWSSACAAASRSSA